MTGERMSQEEFDTRSDAGEDVYTLVGEDLVRQGYVFDGERYVSREVIELRKLLEEAVAWARRPSPIPIEPFREFIDDARAAYSGKDCSSGAVKRWRELIGLPYTPWERASAPAVVAGAPTAPRQTEEPG